MKEIFNNWNELKQKINETEKKSFYIKQREIWYVNLGINIGNEENGKNEDFRRPVLVLKKLGNIYLCVAMTSKGKDNNNFYHKYKENSYMILSQAKAIDRKRFLDKIDIVPILDFYEIIKKLKTFWF